MTKYDEYCYNLMEDALRRGAQGIGITKEACVAYMNLMAGARGAEWYIKEHEEREVTEDGEKMED